MIRPTSESTKRPSRTKGFRFLTSNNRSSILFACTANKVALCARRRTFASARYSKPCETERAPWISSRSTAFFCSHTGADGRTCSRKRPRRSHRYDGPGNAKVLSGLAASSKRARRRCRLAAWITRHEKTFGRADPTPSLGYDH